MNIKHDKTTVLKTGLNLFCNKGYNALGVDELCKQTGMTKGAFYNAFKSKEQFLVEAILLYSENNVKRIKTELDKPQESALSTLQSFYAKMLNAQSNINYIGCFVNNTMAELGVANKNIAKVTDIAFNSFIAAIVPTVSKAQENGEITNSSSALEITELLHSTFYGILTRLKGSQNIQQGINTINLLFNSLTQK